MLSSLTVTLMDSGSVSDMFEDSRDVVGGLKMAAQLKEPS